MRERVRERERLSIVLFLGCKAVTPPGKSVQSVCNWHWHWHFWKDVVGSDLAKKLLHTSIYLQQAGCNASYFAIIYKKGCVRPFPTPYNELAGKREHETLCVLFGWMNSFIRIRISFLPNFPLKVSQTTWTNALMGLRIFWGRNVPSVCTIVHIKA